MALACFYLVLYSACAADETRVVVDSRGMSVAIPVEINRVVKDGAAQGWDLGVLHMEWLKDAEFKGRMME
jgi:hypothetical protein